MYVSWMKSFDAHRSKQMKLYKKIYDGEGWQDT